MIHETKIEILSVQTGNKTAMQPHAHVLLVENYFSLGYLHGEKNYQGFYCHESTKKNSFCYLNFLLDFPIVVYLSWPIWTTPVFLDGHWMTLSIAFLCFLISITLFFFF